MVDLALRPQGVSRVELKAALGWKSDPTRSLAMACDRARVALVRRKVGGEPTRYIGRRL